MSKHRIVFALLCLCTTFIFSEGNYQGGNGTVISRITDEKQTIEIRKLEISNVKAGDMLADSDNIIYDNYTTQNPLGELEWWAVTSNDRGGWISPQFLLELSHHRRRARSFPPRQSLRRSACPGGEGACPCILGGQYSPAGL